MNEMVGCEEHRVPSVEWCLSCQAAIDWNVWRKSCACGEDAIGYVVRSREDVGYYCAEHYEEPAARVAGEPTKKGSPND